jgi:beta-N-acetylhexosaminidase
MGCPFFISRSFMGYSTLIGGKLMVAFAGKTVPEAVKSRLRERQYAGVTLFRALNVENAAQVRVLCDELQRTAQDAGIPPLLIAADQEGGQLQALGEGFTSFPGNMALGATHDPNLAYRIGYATGRELAAVGVNLNYAPVADINSNPRNPNIGVRAFGDDPQQVATLTAAWIRGCQDVGVIATAKHFPGLGDGAVDSHYELPSLPHSRDRLDSVELLPFARAIGAGVKAVMTAHVALPALTGCATLPATLSKAVIRHLLRGQMEYDGLVITDALDMGALAQGAGQVLDVLAAVNAGVDLLLCTADPAQEERVYHGLLHAYGRMLLDDGELTRSTARLARTRQWLAAFQRPDFSVVGCAEHQRLAEEVAAAAITLVRDGSETGFLSQPISHTEKVLVLLPELTDLTPADTSSYETHTLAQELRRYHSNVSELIYPQSPTEQDISAMVGRLTEYDMVILGTTSASLNAGQAQLANAVIERHRRVITVALRTPYDLLAYSEAKTHLCTYSVTPPTMKALAAVLVGQAEALGRLPVTLEPTPRSADAPHGVIVVPPVGTGL